MINSQTYEILNDWGIRTTSYITATSDASRERNLKDLSSKQILARLKTLTHRLVIKDDEVTNSPRMTQLVYSYAIQQAVKYPDKPLFKLYDVALFKAKALVETMPFLVTEENDTDNSKVSRLGQAEEIIKKMLGDKEPKKDIMEALKEIGIDNKATANSYYYRFKNA